MTWTRWAAARQCPTPQGLVVYTCVFGEGYGLPHVDGPGKRLCFTDRNNLEPRGWTVVRVDALLPGDSARSSREQKIRPHRWLHGYDRSIYVDPSLSCTPTPRSSGRGSWATTPGCGSVPCCTPSARPVLEEFGAALDRDYDATERLHEHLRALVLTDPGSLQPQARVGCASSRVVTTTRAA